MWHVLQDPASNQFFRLNEAAYRFVALLDGRKTVSQVWRICSDQLGDSAPTQGEGIQLLGQLYTSNLLHADLPPDAEGLFKRYQKRIRREVQGYLMNLLFIRIPLIDPENFLNATVSMISWLFTWFGFLLWAGLIGTGLYFVIGNWGELYNAADRVLDLSNLPFLYLSFILIKVCHEFGHAFICKTFGKRTGTGGEVHTMGVMFLVFTPMPYVDASSAWAFRSRRQRILVSCGGMIIELGLAAIAAITWANIGAGTLRTICYNAMFIASVSTILFNANPLLRYDGYYILSDLLEIPNLAQRSKQFIYYLVKKYIWNVRQARNPAHTRGEKAWFIFYGVASTCYRVFICVRILLFVADKLFMLGAILAIAAAVAWVLVPLGKFLHYLFTSGELARVRFRAVATTALTLALIIGGIAFIPAPDPFRLEGVVEATRLEIVHAAADGFVVDAMASGRMVHPDGNSLLVAESPDLLAQHEQLAAQRRRLVAQRRLAQMQDQATVQILTKQLAALDDRIERVNEQLRLLTIRAAFAGEWIAPRIDRARGAYLRRGDQIGLLASKDVLIRATAGQDVVDLLLEGPKQLYVLSVPKTEVEPLRADLQAARDARRELRGLLACLDHPDQPIDFVVERIEAEEAEEARVLPAAAPAASPASAPGDAQPATHTAGEAASNPASRPEGAAAAQPKPVAVHIRLRNTAGAPMPPISGLAKVRIARRDYGRLLASRKVNWREVEIRIKARPDPLMTGTITRIIEAGKEQLPSAALGYAGGGSVQTDPKDPKGVKAAERFFEIQIAPDAVEDPDSPWRGKVPLLSGQRVVVRIAMPHRPLIRQWYRALLQLVQRRFKI
jgi:putative peptide zinc metalloprotease protein